MRPTVIARHDLLSPCVMCVVPLYHVIARRLSVRNETYATFKCRFELPPTRRLASTGPLPSKSRRRSAPARTRDATTGTTHTTPPGAHAGPAGDHARHAHRGLDCHAPAGHGASRLEPAQATACARIRTRYTSHRYPAIFIQDGRGGGAPRNPPPPPKDAPVARPREDKQQLQLQAQGARTTRCPVGSAASAAELTTPPPPRRCPLSPGSGWRP